MTIRELVEHLQLEVLCGEAFLEIFYCCRLMCRIIDYFCI